MNTLRIQFVPTSSQPPGSPGTGASAGAAAPLTVEPRVLVDGIDLGEGASYVFDWLYLVAQGLQPGEFDLFTCSCSVPGCAGIHESCVLRVEAEQVIWEVPETAYGRMLRPRVVAHGAPLRFVFEPRAYLQALEDSVVHFEALQRAHPLLQMGGLIDYDEPQEGDMPVPLRPVRELLEDIRRWQASMLETSAGGTD